LSFELTDEKGPLPFSNSKGPESILYDNLLL
jgi:hypothetical protein